MSSLRRRVIVGVVSAVVIAALAAAWWYYLAPHYSVRLAPGAQLEISPRSAIDERQPTPAETRTYTVPADAPRYLTIDGIGVAARVLAVGRDKDGRIGVPPGIWDVAWYTGSAKPGQSGVVFIDGHISGPNLPAVFKDLHRLTSGEAIQIERGDGIMLTYQVRSVELRQLSTINMEQLLTEPIDSHPTLVLMTCGGTFDAHAYSYDQRVVVRAVQT